MKKLKGVLCKIRKRHNWRFYGSVTINGITEEQFICKCCGKKSEKVRYTIW